MALMMVHLLVAQRWARNIAELSECPEFYLGAISPDAIHIRDKDDKSRKGEIHLYNWQEVHPEKVIDYWKENHSPFDIGYGIHVLTDGYWVLRNRRLLPQLYFADGSLDVNIYYNDTFVVDFELYKERNGAQLFEWIERAHVPVDHPLLSQYELEQWREENLRCYHGECPKHDPIRCIDRVYIDGFVEDIQQLLNETYRRYCNE